MRRSDREILDKEKIEAVIAECDCLRLGFVDGQEAYIVPVNFGYETDGDVRRFYFHGAREGRKASLIRTGAQASFEMDCAHALNSADIACGYSYRYRCVMGTGQFRVLCNPDEQIHALRCIMARYTGRKDWTFAPAELSAALIVEFTVTSLSCKEHE